MPSLDFEVWCAVCGKAMCSHAKVAYGSNGGILTIDPCPDCLSSKYDDGYESGHKEGKDTGYLEGYEKGEQNARD